MRYLKTQTLAVFILCIFFNMVNRAETIELKDGNRISGTILSLENGLYTVQSASLGEIQIAKTQVLKITSTDDENTGQDMASLQSNMREKIVSNPSLMNSIMTLKNNPEVQDVLSDPELMRAIANGDLNALMHNEKIKRMMENPEIKSITRNPGLLTQ